MLINNSRLYTEFREFLDQSFHEPGNEPRIPDNTRVIYVTNSDSREYFYVEVLEVTNTEFWLGIFYLNYRLFLYFSRSEVKRSDKS